MINPLFPSQQSGPATVLRAFPKKQIPGTSSKSLQLAFICALLTTSYVSAATIRDKQGRLFEGEFVSATAEELTVRRQSDDRTFTIKRTLLDDNTNSAIDRFREMADKADEPGSDRPGIAEEEGPVNPDQHWIKEIDFVQGEVSVLLAEGTVRLTLPVSGTITTSEDGFSFEQKKGGDRIQVWLSRKTEDVATAEYVDMIKNMNLKRAKSRADGGFLEAGELTRLKQLLVTREVAGEGWKGHTLHQSTSDDRAGKLAPFVNYLPACISDGTWMLKINCLGVDGTLIKDGEHESFIKSFSVEKKAP